MFPPLRVRAEHLESATKKFRRNTCNGDQRQLGGKVYAIRQFISSRNIATPATAKIY